MIQRLRASIFQFFSARVFYGWVILAVALLAMFGSGPGQSHLIGLFFDPISEDLELSRTSIATAYGGATLLAAFLLPQMGRLIDRFGTAAILWIIVSGFGLTAIAFSYAFSWLYLALGFGFLRFLGQGSLMLNCANIVSQWFNHRRGFALGLMSMGFPISMAVHPPLGQWLMDIFGWRQTWVWLGLSTLVLLLPPIILLAYSSPEQVGLKPDGVTDPGGERGANVLTGLTLAEALKTPAFYIICAGLFSLSMLVTTLHVENKGILMSHGLSAQRATLMFTISGITAAVSMPVIGRMLDRFRAEWMFPAGLLVMSASLIASTLVEGLADAVVYAVIFGLNNGVTMTYFAYFWPRFFGRRHFGSIQGVGQMVGVVGASLGPLPPAIALDLLGDYDLTLCVLAVIPVVCAVFALFLRRPVISGAADEAIV